MGALLLERTSYLGRLIELGHFPRQPRGRCGSPCRWRRRCAAVACAPCARTRGGAERSTRGRVTMLHPAGAASCSKCAGAKLPSIDAKLPFQPLYRQQPLTPEAILPCAPLERRQPFNFFHTAGGRDAQLVNLYMDKTPAASCPCRGGLPVRRSASAPCGRARARGRKRVCRFVYGQDLGVALGAF